MRQAEKGIELADGMRRSVCSRRQGRSPEEITFSAAHLAKLIELLDAGTINQTVAKEVFEQIFREDIDPEQYVEAHGLKMVNDDNLLRTVVEQVIAANPQSVADYRGGQGKSPRLPRRPDP